MMRNRITKTVAVLVTILVIGTATVSYGWIGAAVRVIATAWSKMSPEVKAQIASATIHAVGLAGCYIYSLAPSGTGSHKVDGANVKRTGNVTWVDLQDGKTIKQDDVTVRTNTGTMKEAAKNNPAKYPNLKEAASKKDLTQATDLSSTNIGNNLSGKVVKCSDGKNRTLGIKEYEGRGSGSTGEKSNITFYPYSGKTVVTTVWEIGRNQYDQPISEWTSTRYATAAGTVKEEDIPEIESSDEEFAAKIRNGAPQNVYSDYYAEIDDYIKSNPNVLHFEDPTTGEQAIPEYASLSVQASKAADANVSAAQSAASSAQSAASNARARANANPTDNYLAYLADQAEANAAAAEQRLEQATKEQAEAAAEAEKEEDAIGSVPGGGDYLPFALDGEFDFGNRISGFIGNIRNSALFAMPSNIMGNVPNSGNALQTIEMGTTFGSHSIDWSKFDSVWAIVKACFLICMGVVSMKVITRGGAG